VDRTCACNVRMSPVSPLAIKGGQGPSKKGLDFTATWVYGESLQAIVLLGLEPPLRALPDNLDRHYNRARRPPIGTDRQDVFSLELANDLDMGQTVMCFPCCVRVFGLPWHQTPNLKGGGLTLVSVNAPATFYTRRTISSHLQYCVSQK
jgi:hypothetical protein